MRVSPWFMVVKEELRVLNELCGNGSNFTHYSTSTCNFSLLKPQPGHSPPARLYAAGGFRLIHLWCRMKCTGGRRPVRLCAASLRQCVPVR